jgi:hypothetical protein
MDIAAKRTIIRRATAYMLELACDSRRFNETGR